MSTKYGGSVACQLRPVVERPACYSFTQCVKHPPTAAFQISISQIRQEGAQGRGIPARTQPLEDPLAFQPPQVRPMRRNAQLSCRFSVIRGIAHRDRVCCAKPRPSRVRQRRGPAQAWISLHPNLWPVLQRGLRFLPTACKRSNPLRSQSSERYLYPRPLHSRQQLAAFGKRNEPGHVLPLSSDCYEIAECRLPNACALPRGRNQIS